MIGIEEAMVPEISFGHPPYLKRDFIVVIENSDDLTTQMG